MAPPPAPPLPAVTLAADAGLRIVLDRRGWEFAAAPGRIVILGDEFKQLEAFDAGTGTSLWRVKVQDAPNGRHTLHVRGEQVILHAGSTRIHVDHRDGRVLGTFPAFYNSSDRGCALRVQEGSVLAEWNEWLTPASAGSACAEACECDLRLFDCATGAAVGAPLHASETHLYHDLGEPHDTVCFNRPDLLVRAAASTIVRAEDDSHQPAILGLEPHTGAQLWARRDLASTISQYGDSVGADPTGTLCWLADDASAVMLDCATGTTRWQASPGTGKLHSQTFFGWHAGALAMTNHNSRRTMVELRDAHSGKRRWQRSLAADRLPLLPGEASLSYVQGEIKAYALLDLATGATRSEITVAPKETLQPAPEGGYLRAGAGQLAVLPARGPGLRARPVPDEPLVRVTATHVVLSTGKHLSVLRRDTLQPVLTLAGGWSLSPSQAALGPDVLVLTEHRRAELHRVLLLQPTP